MTDSQLTTPQPEYDAGGVDVTLIRWMLSLTPAERLDVLQQNVNAVLELRNAARGPAPKAERSRAGPVLGRF